jgi:hypothetical protein
LHAPRSLPLRLNSDPLHHKSTGKTVYGKEYFADFFAERPQYGSYYDPLPKFYTSSGNYFEFYDMTMITESTGAWSYYNSGYGIASCMYNPQGTGSCGSGSGTQDTTARPMYHNSGTYYGYFNDDWNSSAGT